MAHVSKRQAVRRNSPRTAIYREKGAPWQVPFDDATAPITIHRTTRDVKQGKPNEAWSCMNVRAVLNNKGKFSHHVFMVVFNKGMAFLVDKMDKDGNPLHAFRYKHNDRAGIRMFDDKGGKEYLITSGKADFNLVLTPPPARAQAASKPKQVRQSKPKTKSKKKLNPAPVHGPLGRMLYKGNLERAA